MRISMVLGVDNVRETNATGVVNVPSFRPSYTLIYLFPCQLYTNLTFSASLPFDTTTLLT